MEEELLELDLLELALELVFLELVLLALELVFLEVVLLELVLAFFALEVELDLTVLVAVTLTSLAFR